MLEDFEKILDIYVIRLFEEGRRFVEYKSLALSILAAKKIKSLFLFLYALALLTTLSCIGFGIVLFQVIVQFQSPEIYRNYSAALIGLALAAGSTFTLMIAFSDWGLMRILGVDSVIKEVTDQAIQQVESHKQRSTDLHEKEFEAKMEALIEKAIHDKLSSINGAARI